MPEASDTATVAVSELCSLHDGTELGYADVLTEVLGVEGVSVDSHFFDDLGADSLKMAHFCARVRKHPELPPVSMKDVYRHPTVRGLATALARPAPSWTEPVAAPDRQPERTEQGYADVLTEVLGVEGVSVDSHFFDDLGADSLKMAHFCARVRKHAELPPVSMKDVYRHPTVHSLARALTVPEPASVELPRPVQPESSTDGRAVSQRTTHPRQYIVCGALQLLIFFGYCYLTAVVAVSIYEWISAGSGAWNLYARSVVSGAGLLLFLFLLPLVAKWVLIGRWRPERIPVWSLAYVRFWLVRTLVQRNLLVFVFAGSPLYSLYLRALGAKIGRGVTIFTINVPVCTDLLSIGDGAVVRKDSFLNGFRAHDGVIETGSVTLGAAAYVGEVTVLDIDSSMGDGAQLGHASSLHAGQSVPAGEHWHGSPAEPTEVDYVTVQPLSDSTPRRIGYTVFQILMLLGVYLPTAILGSSVLLTQLPTLAVLLDPNVVDVTTLEFYAYAVQASLLLFFGSLVTGLVVVATVPRLLNLALEPDRVYPLYGIHYTLHRTITRLTNVQVFTWLSGDSSYIVGYLKWLGYHLPDVRQTGSNFGLAVKQDNPYLSVVGSGTVVADGLSVMNADYSSTSFSVSRTTIGGESFLGNRIAYPSQGRMGDNCLVGTKTMIPIDGRIRENVGLLGSPPFEIPRTVTRDSAFDVQDAADLRRLLKAKNRHNLVTIAVYLFVRWGFAFGVTLIASVAASLYSTIGASALALASVLILLTSVCYFIGVERVVGRLQALKPLGCSIYDHDFWRHERYWKTASVAFALAFNGTPFKSLIWRAMGARIGRRVFDDGLALTERKFVTVGDDCTFNAGSLLQTHSQEDGAFKSDHIVVGDRCTLGVGAFVHYGVTIGDGAVLAADSFLMKGEEMPAHARWGGNPAMEMHEERGAPPAVPDHHERRAALVSGL